MLSNHHGSAIRARIDQRILVGGPPTRHSSRDECADRSGGDQKTVVTAVHRATCIRPSTWYGADQKAAAKDRTLSNLSSTKRFPCDPHRTVVEGTAARASAAASIAITGTPTGQRSASDAE